MSMHPEPVIMTEAQYLAFERSSEFRHEFVDGEIRAMSGASMAHGVIVSNAVTALMNQLRGRGCDVIAQGLRVRAPQAQDYLYPDVLVSCGQAELADEHQDTLLNPVIIIEVLSPSTGNYDRGKKWEKYRQIPSLQDYLLVAQDRPHVERYSRHGDGFWLFSEVDVPAALIHLDSVGCALAMSDLYERVRL